MDTNIKKIQDLPLNLSDISHRLSLGHIISGVAMQIRRVSDSFGAEYGLSGAQCRLLGFVKLTIDNGYDAFQRDIETAFHIRRSSVTSLLQNLEKNGFIERVGVDGDARMKKIMLTGKGRDVTEAISVKIDNFEKDMRQMIPEDRIKIVMSVLCELSERLSNY